MQNYEIKTQVRGLPRADGLRVPVAIGEVVALPFGRACELLDLLAIEPTNAAVTCELEWPAFLNGGPNAIGVVAVTDRFALMAAIEELGGLVFFVGEGVPDGAADVLTDFSNEQLLEELTNRVSEGRLAPGIMSALDDGDDAPEDAPAQAHAEAAVVATASSTAQDAPPPVVQAATAPATEKSSRKPKSPAFSASLSK